MIFYYTKNKGTNATDIITHILQMIILKLRVLSFLSRGIIQMYHLKLVPLIKILYT